MTRFSDTLAPRPGLSPMRRRGIAFTLVEMLAVIGIIGILGAAIGIALSGGSSSAASLGNAQRMVHSMFQAARTNAVMKGQKTAVIIYKGSSELDQEKYLRFIGIVYDASPAGSLTPDWKPLNRGTYLPKGIYFVPPDTALFGDGVTSASGATRSQSTDSFKFPIQTTGAPVDEWYLYTFDGTGNLSGGSTYLIFTPADIKGPPVDGKPQLSSDVKMEQMAGIALRKTGGALMIDNLGNNVYDGLKGQITGME